MSRAGMEARLVISADDKASAVIAAIERRAERLNAQFAAMARFTAPGKTSFYGKGGGATGLDATFSRLERAQVGLARAAERLERSVRSLASTPMMRGDRGGGGLHGGFADGLGRSFSHEGGRALGMRGGLHGGAGMMVGMAGGFAAAAAAHEAVRASADRAHEQSRMALSGMTPAEIRAASLEATRVAAAMPAVGATDTMHTLRNARTIVGSYEEAAKIIEPLTRLRVVAQAARPGEDVSEDFDKLVKGLEIKGVTQNPKAFHEYMQGIAQGLNAFGDTLKAGQYYDMFKYGRQATPGLSKDFILSTAPTLAQELGGSSYGKGISSFNRAIVSGIMTKKAMEEMVALGLAKAGDVDAKGALKKGKNIAGWQLAQTDPNEWVKKFLLPALNAHGITDASGILKVVGTLFSNQMAAQLVGLLATQQSRITKDQAIVRGAQGLESADYALRNDPKVAFHALDESLKNLGAELGSGVARALAPVAADIAKAVAAFAKRVAENRDERQRTGDTAADRTMRRALNRMTWGVDSEKRVLEVGEDEKLDAAFKQRRAQLERDRRYEDEDASARIAARRARGEGLPPEGTFERTVIDNADDDERFPRRLGAMKGLRELSRLDRARQEAKADLDAFTTRLARLRMMGTGDPGTRLSPYIGGDGDGAPTFTAFPTMGGGGRRLDYRRVDPGSGMPSMYGPAPSLPSPPVPAAPAAPVDIGAMLNGKVEATLKPDQVKAELEGSVTLGGTIRVEAGDGLKASIAKVEAMSSNPRIKAMMSSGGMNTGTSAPGTGPGGRTPSGR